jgi:dTDP-4-dehydrorhamnose reductase
MRILLTGATGTVGAHLVSQLNDIRDVEISSFSLSSLLKHKLDMKDVTTLTCELERLYEDFTPDLILHCAAATDVDFCEQQPSYSYFSNVVFTQALVSLATLAKANMVYISTSAIYGGNDRIVSNEMDIPVPLNQYAKTKLLAEQCLQKSNLTYAIYRAGWMIDSLRQNNKFVGRIYEHLLRGGAKAVIDKYASLTSAQTLASVIVENLNLSQTGEFNIGSSNVCSRYDVAYTVSQILKLDRPLPCLSSDFPLPAERGVFEGLATCRNIILEDASAIWQDQILKILKDPSMC